MDGRQSQRTDSVFIQTRVAQSSLCSTLAVSGHPLTDIRDAVFESTVGGRHVFATTVQIQLRVVSVTVNVHAVSRPRPQGLLRIE